MYMRFYALCIPRGRISQGVTIIKENCVKGVDNEGKT